MSIIYYKYISWYHDIMVYHYLFAVVYSFVFGMSFFWGYQYQLLCIQFFFLKATFDLHSLHN